MYRGARPLRTRRKRDFARYSADITPATGVEMEGVVQWSSGRAVRR